jgi:Flp pilus assembly protein TadG
MSNGRLKKQLRRGVAATELAVLLPVLCFLFVVAVDFARVFYFDLTLANCVRSGVMYASRDPSSSLDTSGIETAAKKDASNLVVANVGVSSSTNSTTNPTKVTVTVTYPFTTITHYPGIPSTMTLSRTLTMDVAQLKPN